MAQSSPVLQQGVFCCVLLMAIHQQMNGAAAVKAADDIFMAQATAIASFRRVTPGILASARLAMANDVPETSKSEMAILLKKAAPVLGIDGTCYHVMDILLGLTRADDWKGSARPIVAISNAKLAEYTMRSERTVTRCIRKLVEAGIAAYRDSPTGRRFVYRDSQGNIESGFGVDFTPARVRLTELQEAVREYQDRLRTELAARRDIGRYSRAITDAAEAMPERAGTWLEERAACLMAHKGIIEQAAGLKALYNAIAEDAFRMNLTPKGDINDSPYIYTNFESHIDRNKSHRPNGRQETVPDAYGEKNAYEKKRVADTEARQALSEPVDNSTHHKADIPVVTLPSISIDLLRTACTHTQDFIGVEFRGWADLSGAGETMRRMISLSEAAWTDGVVKVGRHAASAIIATVLEKSLRNPEQISKPGGYFRAMIDRATEGNLHLERSLYGLVEAQMKGWPEVSEKIGGGTQELQL